MASEGSSDGNGSDDTREQGIEFGQLKEKLASLDYPTTSASRYTILSAPGPWGEKITVTAVGLSSAKSKMGKTDRCRALDATHLAPAGHAIKCIPPIVRV
jgi:formyltetrahydrofolate synthetase